MNYKIKAKELVNKLLKNIDFGQEVDINFFRNKLIGEIDSSENDNKEELKKEALRQFDLSFQPVIVRQERRVRVTNFPEPQPNELKVNIYNDLDNLKESFISLEDAIKNIKPPIVNVPAPIVNIPETIIPENPKTDIYPIIDELDRSLKLLRTNSKSNPLAVRLSDGSNWLAKLVEIQQETQKAVAAFAGGSDRMLLLDSNRNPVNPASNDAPSTLLNGKTTVTTAGTRVALGSSTTIKSVTVKSLAANTGIIYVGNVSVASTNGYALAAGQAISFDIDNLSKVYLDSSVSAESVTYLAVN